MDYNGYATADSKQDNDRSSTDETRAHEEGAATHQEPTRRGMATRGATVPTSHRAFQAFEDVFGQPDSNFGAKSTNPGSVPGKTSLKGQFNIESTSLPPSETSAGGSKSKKLSQTVKKSTKSSKESREILESYHPAGLNAVYLNIDATGKSEATEQAAHIRDQIVKFIKESRNWAKKGNNFRVIATYEYNLSTTQIECIIYYEKETSGMCEGGKYFLEIQRLDLGHVAFTEVKHRIFWMLSSKGLASTYVNGDRIVRPWSLYEEEAIQNNTLDTSLLDDEDGLGMPSLMGMGLGGGRTGILLEQSMDVLNIWIMILGNKEAYTLSVQETFLVIAKTIKRRSNCLLLARNLAFLKLVYMHLIDTRDSQIATCGLEIIRECMKVNADIATELNMRGGDILRVASKFAGISLGVKRKIHKSSVMIPWRALDILNNLGPCDFKEDEMKLMEKMEKKFKQDQMNLTLISNLKDNNFGLVRN